MGNLTSITSLRKAVRAKRRAIIGDERASLSKQASDHFLNWLATRHDAVRIGSFLSLPEEMDTAPLNHALLARGYSLYLPYVQRKNAPLQWLFYDEKTPLQPDKAGILAPALEHEDLLNQKIQNSENNKNVLNYLNNAIEPAKLDIVITPLVAFDQQGTRLGMGGGFYDRTFQGKITAQSPWLIGIAYPCQLVDLLPNRSWDIPLDAIVTSNGFLQFDHQNGETQCIMLKNKI